MNIWVSNVKINSDEMFSKYLISINHIDKDCNQVPQKPMLLLFINQFLGNMHISDIFVLLTIN